MVCEFDKQSTTEELWIEHSRLSDKFREYVSAVDSSKSRQDLESAEATSFLDLKIELAQRVLQNCHFCERKCGADRTRDDSGWCRLGEESRVSSAFLHTGEEAPLVPSGTIFFSSCCFGCVFCQNEDISTNPRSGQVVTPQELAVIAQALRRDGAININYVGGDPIPNTHTIIAS
ncbi:MAG: 4Fe-4S cluster-binding domain-containing protein, partial [Candidatus Thorarchaeota archaeon]